jgi:hypothetical protein
MKTHEDFLIDSLQDSEETAAYLTAILEEKEPEPELLPLGLGHVAAALGNDSDRQWVQDFAATNRPLAELRLSGRNRGFSSSKSNFKVINGSNQITT